ncbi:hypothetical protein ADK96_22915 [Streptomyces sp. IGB124]|nr:hypothetical protein ADK96_22915 [Streptomyces sp. IGB124]
MVLFQPHQNELRMRLSPSGLPAVSPPHAAPTGSAFIIAFHTMSTMSASRWSGHFRSFFQELSRPFLVPTLIGNPNVAAGADTGSATGAPKSVPALLGLPFGGKIGASRNRLRTLSGCWMA